MEISTQVQSAEQPQQLEYEKKYYKLDFSQLAKHIFNDIHNPESTSGSILFRNFDKKTMMSAMQNPQNNEKTLRNLSNFLYIISPHYKRLCDYYAEMATLDWYISPYNLDTSKVNVKLFKKTYDDTLYLLDKMNIRHEMFKVLQVVFRDGIFYGYEYETDDSYFIQKLDPDYCKISGFEDGVFSFKFDFTFFSSDESKLSNYAPEFKIKYELYKNQSKNKGKNRVSKGSNNNKSESIDLRWQEIDSRTAICIKTSESIYYPFPPFISVLPDIYEIQDYKSLKKANSEMQNYAILSGTIPMKKDNDLANNFAISLDTAINFGSKISSELPEQVGFMLSVFEDMQLFRLSDDKTGSDKVSESVKSFWDSAGVSKNLFADDSNTDAAIRFSTKTDEQTLFGLLRQVERWLNRKLKLKDGKYQFKINMLNTTYLNREETATELLKNAQFGLPIKAKLFASLGGSQSEMESMNYLESLLGLPEVWKPLQSSHTSTEVSVTGGEAGRPTEDEDSKRIDGE